MVRNFSHNFDYRYLVSAADKYLSDTYYLELSNVLRKYGVDEVILNSVEYQYLEDTYIILVKSDSGQNIGGIRVEFKSLQNLLPIEKLHTPYQKFLNSKISELWNSGFSIAELSGLWVNKDIQFNQFNGKLGPELCRRAYKLALGLKADYVVAMPPMHTRDMFLNLGFIADLEIPPMAYPDDRYISSILWACQFRKSAKASPPSHEVIKDISI